MAIKNDKKNGKGILEKTLERLAKRRKAPVYVFVLLLLLYLASAIIVRLTAGSQDVVMLGGNPLYIYTFAGVFSSVSNLCVVLMVIFCGKLGYIVSVIVLLGQFPMMLVGILHGNLSSLPGFFANALTLIVVVVIYLTNRKIEEYQHKMQEQATTDVLTGLPNGFTSSALIND